ncbi:MAG: PilX N-terminal domain-containing pilus assembly protein [Candidatus Binatia bacterium]
MRATRQVKNGELGKILKSQGGFLLVAALVLLASLTMLGTTAYLLSSTDIKVGGGFRNSQQAFQVAQAGVERGREILRQVNANETTGADPTVFNSELVYYAGGGVAVTGGTVGNYSYTVVLSNDPGDAGGPSADSNNKVQLTSTATGPNNTKAVVEIGVSLPPPPTSTPMTFPNNPGTISLLGNSASFIGGNSNAKSMNGDDQCGAASSLPVVSVSAAGSLPGIQSSINDSKPGTYHTNVSGVSVDASTNMNDIAKAMTAGQMNSAGYNLNDPASLNQLVNDIQALPQAVTVADGTSSSAVPGGIGTAGSQKVVVADGDFTLSEGAAGFGILVVKGTLTFSGNINYTGIIMVIGDGAMIRNGGGNGTISGAVWIANTSGADGNPGTADDTMGASVLNTSGGGASNIQYCSSAVANALSLTAPTPTYSPLVVKSFRQVL